MFKIFRKLMKERGSAAQNHPKAPARNSIHDLQIEQLYLQFDTLQGGRMEMIKGFIKVL